MQSKAPTIAAYLAELPPAAREVIATLDALIRAEAPAARPAMKHGMPVYLLGERMVALNAQKHYFAFYADPAVVARHRTALAHLDCGKSCIRFKRLADLPLRVVRAIVRTVAAD